MEWSNTQSSTGIDSRWTSNQYHSSGDGGDESYSKKIKKLQAKGLLLDVERKQRKGEGERGRRREG